MKNQKKECGNGISKAGLWGKKTKSFTAIIANETNEGKNFRVVAGPDPFDKRMKNKREN